MENKKKISKKTICLCSIVKNEEKVIKRLIDSCREIIDYWVIIDTGSTDDTKKIIKKELKDIDGELYESEFVNFGYNRTELVKKAKDKADYLLLADADFTIHWDKTFNKDNLDADMYHVRYVGGLDYAQALLVSGYEDWYYKGVTHEYLIKDVPSMPKEIPGFWIDHHLDGGTRSEKLERDRELLETDILENPSEKRNYFYLAQTYANMREYEKAIKFYQERVNKGGWPEEVYYAKYQIGIMLLNLKKMEEAKNALIDAYEYRPVRFEALFSLGIIEREAKRYNIGKMYLESIINMPYPSSDVLFVHKIQYDVIVHFELAICYYYTKEYEKAEKENRVVLNYDEKQVPENVYKQAQENQKYVYEKLGKTETGENEYVIASMFTVDTPYEKEALKLKAGLDKFGLKYELMGVKPQGSWVKNTHMKPHVIKTVMEKHGKPVVWIDADGEVLEDPKFFKSINSDISFYIIKEWNEMLTGTVYFANNSKVHKFLNAWIEANNQNNLPDAKNFQKIMVDFTDLTYQPLPPEYIKIFDNHLIRAEKPVIVHNQASRRFKNKMNTVRQSGIKELIQPLTGKKRSCSVIGNGPFKTNLSKYINHSFIMRCNNFKTGDKYKEIGKRVDLNISSLYHEIVPTEKVDYPIFGILPISNNLYQEYTTAKRMHEFWAKNAAELINKGIKVFAYGDDDPFAKVFKEVVKEINAFPTVGIMGIATARWLGFKKIILSGFTFFETEKSHYFKDNKVNPSTHHNARAEKELLKKWIEKDNGSVEYVLDELMKEKLYKDASIKSVTA